MDLLNSDATNSNTYSTSDSFYSLETLPPLNFLADATLYFEGHSRRNEPRDGGGEERLIQNRHPAGWSNHESFDLLINAAISEGFYDQNSRLSPTSLGDGLLYGPADVSNYVNLVDISQSAQQSNSTVYEDSLEKNPEESSKGFIVCKIENNCLSIDLRPLFTSRLLNLTKWLKSKPISSMVLPPSLPISLKFPSSDVNIRLRVDQLWPEESTSFLSTEEDSKLDPNSVRLASVMIPNEEDSPLVVSSVNEMKFGEDGKKLWKCHLCENKIYKCRRNLELHFDKHTRKNSLVCSFCRKSFGQPAHLQSHVLRCHAPKSLICRGCDSKFSHRKLLLTHMIKQCKSKKLMNEPIRCQNCPESSFESVRQLGEHYLKNFAHYFDSNGERKESTKFEQILAVESTKNETKFICDICSACFGSTRRLNYHKTNLHVKKHVCKTCHKRFGKKDRLVRHEAKCTAAKVLVEQAPLL